MSPHLKTCAAAFVGVVFAQVVLFGGFFLLPSRQSNDLSQRVLPLEAKIGVRDLAQSLNRSVTEPIFLLRDALSSREFLNSAARFTSSSRPVYVISQGPIDLRKLFTVEAFYRLQDLQSGYERISSDQPEPERKIIEAR